MSAALSIGVAIPVALVILVLLVIVVLVDRRDDEDPQGQRSFAAYVFVVVFLTLFTALFAVTALANSLTHLAIDDNGSREAQAVAPHQTFTFNGGQGTVSSGSDESSSPSFSSESSDAADNARIRDAVRAGLLAAAAGAVLVFHLGMARRAADDSDVALGRALRIYHAYLYATLTLAVVVVVGAATAFGYAVFKVIAPGVASSSGVGDRKHAVPDLVTSAVLLAGAGLIFWYHYRRRSSDGVGPVAALPPAPDSFAPPPEPEPTPPRRPPRKAPAARKTAARRSTPRA